MGEIGKTEDMDLASLCTGGVMNQFGAALEAVGRNILDANTDAEAKRTISIVVTFVPDKNRKAIDVGAKVVVKVPGHSEIRTLAFVRTRPGGKVTMLEHTPPEQTSLDMVEQLRPAVVGGTDTKPKQ